MAKMRVHELAKELEIKSQEIIDSLSGTEYEIKSASNNIDDAAQEIIRKSTKNPNQRQKKNLPQRKQKNQLHQRQRRKRDQRRRNQQMLSMTDQRKSPASQPCLTHSTANRAQDMEITEDRTREQKAEDHRMADARQMTVVTDRLVRQNQRCPAMI